MSPDQRNYLAMERIRGYYDIMRTTVFAMTGIAAVLHLGPDLFSLPLAMLVIAVTAYGILAGGSALADMANLSEDMDDATSTSAYGTGLMGRNIGALRMASAVLLGLVGLAELLAVLF